MKNEKKKKSLGTILALLVNGVAFVAAIAQGVKACLTLQDPFWVLFAAIVWGSCAATIWMVSHMMWEDQL